MTAELSLHNLAVWAAQVFVITSIGAFLPVLFRMRHSRSKLLYNRLLLAAALLLPLIQPMQRDVIVMSAVEPAPVPPTSSTATSAVPQQSASVDWNVVVLGVLVAGFIVRLVWLAGGLWQLRRLRNSSTVVHPLPPAIRTARTLTLTDALFCTSDSVKGPVTFGFRQPIVLLPAAFLNMTESAQLSIACHELIHVRRKDWLLTMAEEVVAALLWFQPAVWWLLADSRLAREQVVDASVVSITAARESYINTLYSLAGGKWEADIGVASLFLHRRQLTQRVHSLLAEVSMSRLRLMFTYCSMAGILTFAGWLILASLPLVGQAEVRYVPPAQNRPGYVVNRAPLFYPADALQRRIEGQVVVELSFNTRGEVVDSRVLSGREELRLAAMQTALQGKYEIDSERTLQVIVDFKLPAAGQRGVGPTPVGAPPGQRNGARQPAPAPRPSVTITADGAFTQLSGSVVDRSRNSVSGTGIPGVRITATSSTNANAAAVSVLTNANGEYQFSTLPGGAYTLSADMPGFRAQSYNGVKLADSQQVRLNFGLVPDTPTPGPGLPFPVRAAGTAPARVRVGANVAASNLIAQVKPDYPADAKAQGITGAVILEADINREGKVVGLNVVSGDPVLAKAAMDAVRQWVYQPLMMNSQPVDVVTMITVNFQ